MIVHLSLSFPPFVSNGHKKALHLPQSKSEIHFFLKTIHLFIKNNIGVMFIISSNMCFVKIHTYLDKRKHRFKKRKETPF